MNAFTQSRFERAEDDHYPTIDPRCLNALLDGWDMPGPFIDPCVGEGKRSALIDQRPDLFVSGWIGAHSIVTNPPYKRGVVDRLVRGFVDRVEYGACDVAACLLRTQWDHAKGRAPLFSHKHFAGLIRLRFRPWWSESREKTPIHSYQWIVWDRRHNGPPIVKYSEA